MWTRRLVRAVVRGLAASASVIGPAVSPWPIAVSDERWREEGGRARRAAGLRRAERRLARLCGDCRCSPPPGHPERLSDWPPDETERALWAQFAYGSADIRVRARQHDVRAERDET